MMFRMSLVLRSLASAAFVLLLASGVWAGFALKVAPIPIVIGGGGTSTMVELRNDGTEPVRLQASTFLWSQTAAGADKLEPTNEILVFPSMVTLKGGETRRVRVGTQGGYGPAEKSFRVIFGELPSNVSHEGQDQVVKVIAQVSVPIFVTPSGAAPTYKIQGLTATKDRVRFQIENTGTAHTLVEKIHLEFRDPKGGVIGATDVAGWYVLPGQTRPFDIPIEKGLRCGGAASLVVTASSNASGSSSATLAQPACAK
jgi:fimbrial chaperone protein